MSPMPRATSASSGPVNGDARARPRRRPDEEKYNAWGKQFGLQQQPVQQQQPVLQQQPVQQQQPVLQQQQPAAGHGPIAAPNQQSAVASGPPAPPDQQPAAAGEPPVAPNQQAANGGNPDAENDKKDEGKDKFPSKRGKRGGKNKRLNPYELAIRDYAYYKAREAFELSRAVREEQQRKKYD